MTNFFRQNFLGFATRTLLVAGFMAGMTSQVHAGGMDPQSDPKFVNAYVAVGYGFQMRTGCSGADVCEAGRDALKIFGGYRFTPSLATEISYFYLGKQDKTWGTGNPNRPSGTYIDSNNSLQSKGTVGFESAVTQALGLGVALESELFPNAFQGRLVQYLRTGLAVSQVKKDQTWNLTSDAAKAGQPTKTTTTKLRVFPYLGAGMSFGLTSRIRIFGNSDVLLNPDKTHFAVTFGAGGEF